MSESQNTADTATEPLGDGSAGIIVEGVARSFGRVHAVRDASLTLHPGTVTGLIGPNGSGKTTLMLMLGSLLVPDRGTIRIAGFDPVTQTAQVRARLGWMPDTLGSWATLSVRSALQYTARMYGMDRATASARADSLISLVDLVELADQPTRVLSRGQKQRLSLARALVHDPSVLLLDEPASGLDPGARIALRTLVRRVASEGTTVLVSSHVLSELDEMADNAVYMEAGVTASDESVARARTAARPWRIRATDMSALAGELARVIEVGSVDGVGVRPAVDTSLLPRTGSAPRMSPADAAAQVTADRGEVLVPVAGDEAAAELLSALVAAGLRISSFTPAVGDLENAFLDLSRSRVTSQGADPHPGTTDSTASTDGEATK